MVGDGSLFGKGLFQSDQKSSLFRSSSIQTQSGTSNMNIFQRRKIQKEMMIQQFIERVSPYLKSLGAKEEDIRRFVNKYGIKELEKALPFIEKLMNSEIKFYNLTLTHNNDIEGGHILFVYNGKTVFRLDFGKPSKSHRHPETKPIFGRWAFYLSGKRLDIIQLLAPAIKDRILNTMYAYEKREKLEQERLDKAYALAKDVKRKLEPMGVKVDIGKLTNILYSGGVYHYTDKDSGISVSVVGGKINISSNKMNPYVASQLSKTITPEVVEKVNQIAKERVNTHQAMPDTTQQGAQTLSLPQGTQLKVVESGGKYYLMPYSQSTTLPPSTSLSAEEILDRTVEANRNAQLKIVNKENPIETLSKMKREGKTFEITLSEDKLKALSKGKPIELSEEEAKKYVEMRNRLGAEAVFTAIANAEKETKKAEIKDPFYRASMQLKETWHKAMNPVINLPDFNKRYVETHPVETFAWKTAGHAVQYGGDIVLDLSALAGRTATGIVEYGLGTIGSYAHLGNQQYQRQLAEEGAKKVGEGVYNLATGIVLMPVMTIESIGTAIKEPTPENVAKAAVNTAFTIEMAKGAWEGIKKVNKAASRASQEMLYAKDYGAGYYKANQFVKEIANADISSPYTYTTIRGQGIVFTTPEGEPIGIYRLKGFGEKYIISTSKKLYEIKPTGQKVYLTEFVGKEATSPYSTSTISHLPEGIKIKKINGFSFKEPTIYKTGNPTLKFEEWSPTYIGGKSIKVIKETGISSPSEVRLYKAIDRTFVQYNKYGSISQPEILYTKVNEGVINIPEKVSGLTVKEKMVGELKPTAVGEGSIHGEVINQRSLGQYIVKGRNVNLEVVYGGKIENPQIIKLVEKIEKESPSWISNRIIQHPFEISKPNVVIQPSKVSVKMGGSPSIRKSITKKQIIDTSINKIGRSSITKTVEKVSPQIVEQTIPDITGTIYMSRFEKSPTTTTTKPQTGGEIISIPNTSFKSKDLFSTSSIFKETIKPRIAVKNRVKEKSRQRALVKFANATAERPNVAFTEEFSFENRFREEPKMMYEVKPKLIAAIKPKFEVKEIAPQIVEVGTEIIPEIPTIIPETNFSFGMPIRRRRPVKKPKKPMSIGSVERQIESDITGMLTKMGGLSYSGLEPRYVGKRHKAKKRKKRKTTSKKKKKKKDGGGRK